VYAWCVCEVTNLGVEGSVNGSLATAVHCNESRDASSLGKLTLPTFENLADQNPVQHLNLLDEYMALKCIPTHLRLPVAFKSLKGVAVRTWGTALSDVLRTYDVFRKAFIEQYWDHACQTKARIALYQDKFRWENGLSLSNHLLRYVVRAKFLQPALSDLEFLSIIRGHYPTEIERGLIIAQPKSIQEAVAFLKELESSGQGNPDRGHEHRAYDPRERDYQPRPRNSPQWRAVSVAS
jgi:hypothetical protein